MPNSPPESPTIQPVEAPPPWEDFPDNTYEQDQGSFEPLQLPKTMASSCTMQWLPRQESYLHHLLDREAPPEDRRCIICQQDGVYKCQDCLGEPLYCTEKAPSKKEIELRLLEEGNTRNAAPSRRSVATWISTGLAIEEAQIALLIEVRRIGRRSTETQRLDIARQRDRLQGQIDGFARSALTHLGEGFDADDEPEDWDVDILDDLDDDPADFTETSHTWTNSPELTVIPLPSNLGVDRCRRCMAEDLIPLEMSLCEGQANDALHNLRIYLCNKAILFRMSVRQANSQALKTRAWSQVMSVQQAVSLHASIYTKTRKQMMKLEPGQDQLQKYKPLLREQLKISTAVGDPNARGQRNESLAWFWSVEVDLGGPDQSWNEEFYRVHWLRAKALRDRWREEMLLVKLEMDWTCKFFLWKTTQWGEHMQESLEKRLPGHGCYAGRQSQMYSLLAQDAQAAFQDLQNVLIEAGDE
ncbi:hypothetical protein EV424DRAFT_1538731 [Suillus variegatus]|nr:hypothetical protein EV424DRAFT_1538731 [Suillus variegatus]